MPTLQTQHPIENKTFDVAIIGAGINGLAVAREASLRGLSVIVLERDDIGSRTSSISTRLIHGGLKYLERLEFRLVFECVYERTRLLKLAPHLVHPCPMLIPFYRGASRPGWLMASGLLLHDMLSVGKPLPHNRVVGRKALRRNWASLDKKGLRWAGLFEDAYVPWTERLCIELAVSASDNGCLFFTRAEVIGLISDGRHVTGVRYRDKELGTEHEVKTRTVVNAAGPWVDSVLDTVKNHDNLVGPTKGSHLVVDPFDGAPDSCIFFEARADKRPMFVLPWAGRFMLGTTDIPFNEDLDVIIATDEEVEYLLAETNALIPQANLQPEDVLWSYSGVRPLPYVKDLSDPSKVTRDHQIIPGDREFDGLMSIVGGKLTTHRALGEQTVDKLVKKLGKGRKRSQTRNARFPGAPKGDWNDFVQSFVAESELTPEQSHRLVSIYGTRAELISQLIVQSPSLGEVIDSDSGALAAEVVFAIHEEGARSLEDVLMRRTLIGLNGDVGMSCAPLAAQIAVQYAGWTEDRAQQEIAAYAEATRRFRPRVNRQIAAVER
jgi:glycerol-3-phosphate dehydrogenase